MSLQQTIEQAFENRNEYSPANMPQDVREAIEQVLEQLDNGSLRVAEKKDASIVRAESMDGHTWRIRLVCASSTRKYGSRPGKRRDRSAAGATFCQSHRHG